MCNISLLHKFQLLRFFFFIIKRAQKKKTTFPHVTGYILYFTKRKNNNNKRTKKPVHSLKLKKKGHNMLQYMRIKHCKKKKKQE